jgi:hypothetical protein
MNGGPCEAVVFDLGGVVFNWSPPDWILSLWPHLAKTRDEAQALALTTTRQCGGGPATDWRAIQFVDATPCEKELTELGALPSPRQTL